MIGIFKKASIAIQALCIISCGTAGDSGSTDSLGSGEQVVGSISSQSGSQAEMQGWVVVLLDKATEAARVAEVNSAGLFTFSYVDLDATYTLVLISPSYIVSSVLSIPGKNPNTVRQYFKIVGNTLPRLIHKGPIITLQNEIGVTVEKDLATDVNGDLIPDGIANVIGIELTNSSSIVKPKTFSKFDLVNQTSTADFDNDGIKNVDDPDIDGDGLANVFDADDDGDQTYDVFDQDSDGDAIIDVGQQEHDLFFPVGVEWISVKFEMVPSSGGSFTSSLTFFTQLRKSDSMPKAVSIRGAPYLLSDALVNELSPDGEPVPTAWNRLLADDGKSEDSGEGDLLFAKKVILKGSKTPAFHQVVFFQLIYGSGDNIWTLEFPYTFAPLKPKGITTSYSKLSRTIKLSGNPFGDIQDFIWTASVFDPDNIKIYTSPPTTGTTRSIKIPENIFEDDLKYTYKVTAQVLDRVPGYVNYTIDSEEAALE
ncbi:MAG: hypothetical protein R3B45_02305 [Bdellovibrionota bacterium]